MSLVSADLAPIEEIIADAKKGRMFILVDDEARENEGDLVIPAEKTDASIVNFMAKHARGLICLALDKARVDALGLKLMPAHNYSRHQTAFTVSIEAREGVTTGISAADRAQTIKVAIDESKDANDIVTPGHIFPLLAREGGVLVRAGHTEAAVDIARAAGLHPSGVICEIMNEDGTMARLHDLIPFARQHGLKIATIADLIQYRRRNEKLVERVMETSFHSHHGGEFKAIIFRNQLEHTEHLALMKGTPTNDSPTLVRVHALDIVNDVLAEAQNPKQNLLHSAMEIIGKQNQGVIILIREPRKDHLSERLQKGAEHPSMLRDYGIGAQILLDVGVRKMILLSNSDRSPIGLEGYGLEIVGRQPIQ